ncbi:putative epoxide hydrolase [Grifola frondosa]|uniref:Putative epoxide hydrolase n=1 Tax=Grifola frondosa TaxID=5627 RepID=A0A1C7M4E0_GRIFR|nr:putative epoxide hydrolase [Grifola frondosa]
MRGPGQPQTAFVNSELSHQHISFVPMEDPAPSYLAVDMSGTSEQPFKISVSDSDIELLHKKLELARLPDELDEAGWEYGVPLTDVQRLIARWKNGFDWRKAEAKINELPQFTRDIEVDGFGTLDIHYIHQKSKVQGAIPLLFVHGWPGHFLEVRKILPLLTAESSEHPSFHVVALSLPNFGFSEGPKKKGFGQKQYAEVSNKLMLALGYDGYVVQGGDWGFIIGRNLATFSSVKAWHTNLPLGTPPSLISHPLLFLSNLLIPRTAAERRGWSGRRDIAAKEWVICTNNPHSRRPWIYEKLVLWSDGYAWEDDEVLEWVSVYWFSRAGPAASVRIYYEINAEGSIWGNGPKSSTPLGLSYFPKEIVVVPKSWARTIGKVVFEAEHTSGGHFAAVEKHEELVGDLRKMFAKKGPAYGVVRGKSGYA